MPDFGSPVAQNVQSPSFTTTLGGLLDLKSKQQQLQVGANQAQQATQTMQERQRITQMLSTGVDDQGASIRGADGNPDPAKILPALGRIAPLTGQQVGQSILATHTAKVGLQSAALGLDSKQREALMGPIQAIATNPNDPNLVGNVSGALDGWAKAHPEMEPLVSNVKTTLLPHIVNALPAQRAMLANSMAAMLQGGARVETQPQAGSMDNGQVVQPGTVAPPVAGGGFTPSGPATQKQLPPTTPVMRGNTPSYVGAPGQPPVQSGPAIGQVEGTTGPIAANNAHFAKVAADAEGAPNRLAALQTIKEQIPQAATGGGDWRRTILSQLSGVFNIANDTQTANDVMAKNLAIIAGQSGNTDAARTLGEMGNPNFHMTKDAAQKAADQLIGIEAKKQAAQRFFSGMTTNDPSYAAKQQAWNAHADPRAFEYASKSPTEQAAMKAELQKAGTWKALQQHMLQLHQMGVAP